MPERTHGTLYTLAFAGAVCLVCALAVAGAAVGLRPAQEANALLFQQRTILRAAGLLPPGRRVDAAAVGRLFVERIEPVVIDLATGEPVEVDYETWRAGPRELHPAGPNPAGVTGLPAQEAVFRVLDGSGAVDQYVLRLHGKGLWSTLRAFLALDTDGRTIRGVSFYEQGETPGLGAEVENPAWNARWEGVFAVDARGEPVFTVVKGRADPGDRTAVDGLSGATLTADAVQAMVRFWVGGAGYGPFLERVRAAATGGGDG